MAASIAHGAIALLSTQPLTWAASFLTITLGPRLLGSDAMGQLAIAGTISTLASTAAGLGMSEFLVRRIAQHPSSIRRDQGVAIAVQMTTACLVALAIALAGLQLPHSFVEYPFLLVGLVPMLGAPAQTVLLSSFRGGERHKSYAWFNASGVVVMAVSSTIVLLVGGNAVLSSATAGLLSIVTTVVAWKLSGFRPSIPSLDRQFWVDAVAFIRAGLPFISWQMTQMAYSQVDRVLLALLVPASQIGWYTAANRIIAIPIFIPTLIVTPLFPALSRSVHEPHLLRRTIADTLRCILLLTIPLSAGTIVVAPVIPMLLGWPEDFSGAVLPMSILSVQLPLVAVGMVLGSVLMAIGRERRLVGVAIVATVFNIAANLLVIPAAQNLTGNGGTGAALVTLASEVLMLIGALTVIPKSLLSFASFWDALRVSIAGACTAVVGATLLPFGLIVCVPAAAATYILTAALFGVLTPADLRRVMGLLSNRLARQPE